MSVAGSRIVVFGNGTMKKPATLSTIEVSGQNARITPVQQVTAPGFE